MAFSFLKQCLPRKVDPTIDAILNETIVSEITYYGKLHAFEKHYGDMLLDIASGAQGKERQIQLRLNLADIELLCGKTLKAVLECSEDLIETLRPFNEKGERPKTQAGRVWMMIGIFNDFLERINDSYAPYIRSYKECLQMLQKKEAEIIKTLQCDDVSRSSSRLKLLALPRSKSRKLKKQRFDYLALWDLVTAEQYQLTDSRMDSILIMPVQRTFQTKMRFERLLKQAGEKYPLPPYYDELEKLIHELGRLGERLNKSI